VKLNDALGPEAAGDLVNWMDEVRADHAELRHQFDLVKAEMVTLRQSVRADINEAFTRQTRWMLGGLALILTAILFKG
jgi:hypothetical protein